MVLILLARVESSVSCKTSTRMAQVTGFLPFPFSHSSRISVLILEGSEWCLLSMFLTFCPVSSSRRRVPKHLYSSPISFAMLILFSLASENLSSSGSVGLPARE